MLDVVGTRVVLKKAGSNFKGLCPFHDEKTPSFTVSPEKGFYHCFGFSAHGTAIGFLMDYENMSFPEAVEALADMLGLEVPTDGPEQPKNEIDDILQVLREADQIYRGALRRSEVAIDYLKGRGIDGETAARFGIGYSPDAWDTVLTALGSSEEGIQNLLHAGLVLANEQGRRYDRFRHRIMFPIRDSRGNVIGFGGRLLDAGEPKYMNSPETPVFHKGSALYGLYEAREHNKRPDEMIVVEGYLDVASLAQHGFPSTVATLGTATTSDNIRQLTRLTDSVVFCFDGDRAGRAAAWRALETAAPFSGGKVELKFLMLPEGDDPDSFVRERGTDAFAELLVNAVPMADFFVEQLMDRVNAASVEVRSRLLTFAKPLLTALPATARAAVSQALADRLGLAASHLAEILVQDAPQAKDRRPAVTSKRSLVRKTIALVIHYPQIAGAIPPLPDLEDIDQPGAKLLNQVLETTREIPHISTALLVERFREDAEGRYLGDLAAEPPIDDETAAPTVLRESLQRIVEKHRRQKMAEAVKASGVRGLDG